MRVRLGRSVLVLSLVACGAPDGPDGASEDGEVGGHCYPNGTCNVGLACVDGVCVPSRPPGDAATSDAILPHDSAVDADIPTDSSMPDAAGTSCLKPKVFLNTLAETFRPGFEDAVNNRSSTLDAIVTSSGLSSADATALRDEVVGTIGQYVEVVLERPTPDTPYVMIAAIPDWDRVGIYTVGCDPSGIEVQFINADLATAGGDAATAAGYIAGLGAVELAGDCMNWPRAAAGCTFSSTAPLRFAWCDMPAGASQDGHQAMQSFYHCD